MTAQVDRYTVNGEQIVPQPGGFHGGSSIQRKSRTGVLSRGQPTDRRGV
jgi:hypothetical protein